MLIITIIQIVINSLLEAPRQVVRAEVYMYLFIQLFVYSMGIFFGKLDPLLARLSADARYPDPRVGWGAVGGWVEEDG